MLDEKSILVRWPRESGKYKVVQFCGDKNTPYLRFGKNLNTCSDFHEDIVTRFGKEFGISLVSVDGVANIPLDSQYLMSGAGTCELDAEKKAAIFYGQSQGYSIGINKAHLEKLREKYPEWKISF